MSGKGKTITVWTLSVIITLLAVVYQRRTGPTYPVKGVYALDGREYPYRLIRSESGDKDIILNIPAPDASDGFIIWKRYPSSEPYTVTTMNFGEGKLTGHLPNQPPAGKLRYFVVIFHGNRRVALPANGRDGAGESVTISRADGDVTVPIPEKAAVARYKGEVPAVVLIPHILLMFTGMLIANRAGIGVLFRQKNLDGAVILTFICLVLGGLVLGCTVQYYAFGEPWTGFPVGHDLTDNKIGIALLAWLWPLVNALRKDRRPSRRSILVAALVTLLIYLIPHSVLGSEIKYD